MRTDIFTLAQGAIVLEGQLNIVGAFDRLSGAKFPLALNNIKLAIRLRHNATDIGEHNLEFRLIDDDGNVTARVPSKASLTGSDFQDAEEMGTAIALPIGLRFHAPGNYRMELYADDELIGYTPIMVRQD